MKVVYVSLSIRMDPGRSFNPCAGFEVEGLYLRRSTDWSFQ